MDTTRSPRDGIAFVIGGLFLLPVAAFFSFSFSYLGMVTLPLVLVALLLTFVGMRRRAQFFGTSVAMGYLKALGAVVLVAVGTWIVMFAILVGTRQ